jgi:hypothetical protein
MRWTAGAIVSGVLVCVFIAIAVSVVDARRPLDKRVVRSFDATIERLAGDRKDITSKGCVKTRLYYYACSARFRRPSDGAFDTIRWMLVYRDDGCWSALRKQPVLPADQLGRLGTQLDLLRGCIAA